MAWTYQYKRGKKGVMVREKKRIFTLETVTDKETVREIQLFFTVIFISLRILVNIFIEFSTSVLHLHTKRNQNKYFRKGSYIPSIIQRSQVSVAISDHEQEYFSSVGKRKKIVGHIKTLRTVQKAIFAASTFKSSHQRCGCM